VVWWDGLFVGGCGSSVFTVYHVVLHACAYTLVCKFTVCSTPWVLSRLLPPLLKGCGEDETMLSVNPLMNSDER
jgi:hypothetical protein